MILRHFQFGFAGVMECSLVAAVDGRTYVFGVTSTAFVWSEARRKMTHELGRMPLLDAMAGRVYLSFSADAVHCRLPKNCQSLCGSILRQRQLRRQDNREVLSQQSFTCLSLLQLRRTEPYAAPITQKIIVGLWGYD